MLERLQKSISRAGVASRRHAEDLIVSGQVQVNGKIVTELGAKADPQRDSIKVAGKLLHFPAANLYLALHKPPGFVSTLSDPEGRRTVQHLLRGISGRVFPVGRLEYHAAGLLLLTSDGELAARVLKASRRGLPQTYWIKVKGHLPEEQLAELGRTAKVRLHRLSRGVNPWYEVTLVEARRDVLRSRLMQMGHPVEKVKRVKLAGLELGGLPPGQYRHLTAQEIAAFERAIARAIENAANGNQPSPIHESPPGFKRRRRVTSRKPRTVRGSQFA